MYTVEPPNTVVAIDARTGRPYWIYHHPVPPTTYVCCGNINRGLAVLGDTLYLGTLDAHLVALDISTGRKKWQTKVAEYTHGYGIAVAPLAVKDKIDGRAGGRRARHFRIPGRLRCEDRQGALAVPHHSAARRARQ